VKFKALILLVIVAVLGLGYYFLSVNKQATNTIPTKTTQAVVSPTPYLNTQQAIAAILANKYLRPISEVNVTVDKEVPGFAAGSVLFGQGGPGEGGMWLAVLENGWMVVWDGNGNVDCDKIRQDYGFPDTILKPNFCN